MSPEEGFKAAGADQQLESARDEQRRGPADERKFAADEVLPISRGCSLRFYRHPGDIEFSEDRRRSRTWRSALSIDRSERE